MDQIHHLVDSSHLWSQNQLRACCSCHFRIWGHLKFQKLKLFWINITSAVTIGVTVTLGKKIIILLNRSTIVFLSPLQYHKESFCCSKSLHLEMCSDVHKKEKENLADLFQCWKMCLQNMNKNTWDEIALRQILESFQKESLSLSKVIISHFQRGTNGAETKI